MRIAAWNVERLKHRRSFDEILRCCEDCCADILVLTETDHRLHPDFPYFYESQIPTDAEVHYAPTENRVSIFTKYPCVRQYETCDAATSLCVELETERGQLIVYGTIIGIHGNRHRSYGEALLRQAEDIRRLSRSECAFCFCGDYNCSFFDNYYFTRAGRAMLLDIFAENHLRVLTGNVPECIDHIAVSHMLVENREITVTEWNKKKTLSDHKGIAVSF